MLTVPGPSQVVYKRFAMMIAKLQSAASKRPFTGTHPQLNRNSTQSVYLFSFIIILTLLSSMDSDLEAFSHNPTDGSFTALVVPLTVFTNYLNKLFLSY